MRLYRLDRALRSASTAALLASLVTACNDGGAHLSSDTAGTLDGPPVSSLDVAVGDGGVVDERLGAETKPPGWNDPDPQGRTTEGDLSKADPALLIVTSKALEAAWAPYAEHRTLGGMPAAVMTVEAITAAHPSITDPAAAVKAELLERYLRGALKAVLLGGDSDVVPIHRVEMSVATLLGVYSSNGPAELYFGDLDNDWNATLSAALLRTPEIAVGRVPVKTAADVAAYFAKIKTYEFQPAGRATYPLAISDIAATLPIIGAIDGAEGMEPTMTALWPAAFQSHTLKLYATQNAATAYKGELFTVQKAQDAFNTGYLLGFHNGHGSYDYLTYYLDTSWVNALQNTLPPVFVSCACWAGNFADVATSDDFHDWTAQGSDDASVGERFIIGQRGGVAYVGNTGTGLGPVGGSQFIDGIFDGLFAKGLRRIGDAMNHAHATMRSFPLSIFGIPMPVDDNDEYWTHLTVVLLGDPALEVWTAEPAAAGIVAPTTYGPGFQQLEVTVNAGGAPFAGATVTLQKKGDFLLQSTTDGSGVATFKFIPKGPAPIQVGVAGPNLIGGRGEIQPSN